MPALCVIEGDGIGHEVIPAAVRVLQAVLPGVEVLHAQAGWECFCATGEAVPQRTIEMVGECGAALFGAVSSPSYKVSGYRSAILTLRQKLGCYANIRPVRSLVCHPPIKPVDLVIVRENSEGLYSGREHQPDADTAIAERVITRGASQRIAHRAVEIMRRGNYRRLTIIHKANILPLTDGLFRDEVRKAVQSLRKPLEDWVIDEMLVDTAAYQLVRSPEQFGVLVTTNLFGDILSDVAAHWCGGMGLAPSLNWGDAAAIAEPVHGSAPDIAGMGIANPLAAILSAALLVRLHWEIPEAADRIERGVRTVLERFSEVIDQHRSGSLTTASITEAVLQSL